MLGHLCRLLRGMLGVRPAGSRTPHAAACCRCHWRARAHTHTRYAHTAPPSQDPADRSWILADEALQGLTGEQRFKGFGFSKLVKQHLLG